MILDQVAISGSALAKERVLLDWLARQRSVLIGYSGGVDSAYLASCALEALGREHVLAVVGRSASLPAEQWRAARETAEVIGVTVEEVDTEEMADPRYAANPSNRCYFCKTELWGRLAPVARARGFAVVVDGTNASDLGGHRPGMAAAREQGVMSPLADAGLTKDEIRTLSRGRGLPTWSQPSAPCLASRIPYGTAVTPERLRAVERSEEALRASGITGDLRVRHHGPLARIEIAAELLDVWLAPEWLRRLASAARAGGFARVAVDLRGFRTGGLLKLERRDAGSSGATAGAPPVYLAVGDREDSSMSPALLLRGELARLGLDCEVRTEGEVVVLTTGAPERLTDPAVRENALAAADALGVRSLALELRDAT